MGTTLHARVAARSRAAAIEAIEDAFQAVRRVDSLLSTWRKDSEIARLNTAPPHRPVALSPELYRILKEAARWSEATGGAFDPAIGSLVDVWDLRGAGRIPVAEALARARAAAGLRRFQFDEAGTVTRRDSAAWIDTGGFGKGVALREARRALIRHGVRAAILNFGGQVLALGTQPGADGWQIPVAHPSRRAEPVLWLRWRDGSVSTSSQSERFVTPGGRRLGHVLDPRTGEPVSSWGSVTVVAEDPVVADILSTALLVLGPETGLRWAEARQDLGVLFLIQRDGRLERRGNQALARFLVTPDSTIHLEA